MYCIYREVLHQILSSSAHTHTQVLHIYVYISIHGSSVHVHVGLSSVTNLKPNGKYPCVRSWIPGSLVCVYPCAGSTSSLHTKTAQMRTTRTFPATRTYTANGKLLLAIHHRQAGRVWEEHTENLSLDTRIHANWLDTAWPQECQQLPYILDQ